MSQHGEYKLKTKQLNKLVGYGVWGLLAFTLVGCGNQPTTFSPNNTDRFVNHNKEFYQQASKILAADYLFVVDPSYSQSSYKSQIRTTLQNFMDNLDNSKIDYRIGYLNGNFQASTNSTPIPSGQGASLIGGNFLVPGFSTNTDVINSISDTIGNPLAPNRTVILETAARYVTNQAAQFVRAGAQLVYIFITDSDDRSQEVSGGHTGDVTSSSSYYVSQLKKPKPNASYVTARAITNGGFDGVSGGCSGTTGQRVYNTAYYINQGSGGAGPNNYCIQNDLNINMSNLARDISKPTQRFLLLQKPASTITVKVNGVDRPQAGNWSYSPSTNEIVFANGQQPGPTDQLEIIYTILFALSRTPKESTVQVTINGVTASGWTYNAAQNRIDFNIGSEPPIDAEVLVSYEIQ